ncbi:MAG: EFR1 family ferrodoxin [Ruminococcus sp.]|nr:EFR1 family ferrodoxin [Ruminococcus sp.]MCM1382088.1 EFR1 family ferrodoxin [Muribaculaceae bacterium]MCM1480855.1 EFR1 family ferrodoxin [Muribaculaceae bacterium]
MVFYFTGTGNSLYAAKQLDTELISIPQAVKNKNQKYAAEKIGLVYPVYGHEAPQMVREFVKNAEFVTDYLFVVLTYGNRHGGAAELARDMLADFGKKADYIRTIKMVDNFLPAFDMEEQTASAGEKRIEENLAEIKAEISARVRRIEEVTEADRAAHREFLSRSNKISGNLCNIYTVSDQCIGCGICMKVCPGGCIRVENQRAVYAEGNCQMCMACIHHCPQKAIGLKMPEKNPNARFHNEHIRLTEIAEANNQGQK